MTDDIQEVIAEAPETPTEVHEDLESEELAPEGLAADTSATVATTAALVLRRGGADTDIRFPLAGSSLIGRFDPSVGPIDVDLGSLTPEGTYVSRKHAKIVFADGAWSIQDLGSSNGTFLLRDDFERVETAELADGQEIAFGNARFVFRLDSEPVGA